jgi:hypothetical protein
MIAQVNNNGEGSIGAGVHVGGGVYDFNNLELPFSAKSYAILPESRSIFDGSDDPYTGGVDIFPRDGLVQEGFGNFDIGFNATFTAVPEPGTYALLAGLGVSSLFAVRRLRRRKK